MKNIYFYLTLTSLVAFFVTGCAKEKVEPKKPDPVAPVISEVEPVENPTFDQTPDYQFISDQAGSITYGGSCSSSTENALAGSNTFVTFNELNYGTYSDCTILVTNSAGLASNELSVSSFTIKEKPKKQAPPDPPVLKEVTPVDSPTFDRTPIYTFSSTKEGKIDYRGGCSSSISWANAGTNTITFNELNYMTYSDCTIAVTDSDGVQSEVLEVSAFTVEMKPKPKQEPEPVVSKPEPEPEPAPAPEPEPVVAEPEPAPAPAPAPEEVAEIEEAEIAIEKDADESVEAPKPMTIITAPPEEMESAVIEMGMVYFDYDKSNISSTFAEIIEMNYEWIAENPDVRIQLEGHCDERGTNEYNLALGERRAKAVFEYLVKLGANPSQFTMVSFGEERPVASGSNEVDWAKNRRVEFTRL